MIVICDFMINNLRLRGDELLVYAIIYGFVQSSGQTWHLDYVYISKLLGLTEEAIDIILDDLCNKDYIKYQKMGEIIILPIDE